MSSKRLEFNKEKLQALWKAWVKNLRSRKFQQGRGQLCYKDKQTGADCYCCLGVLCKTIEELHSVEIMQEYMGFACAVYDNYMATSALPPNLMEDIGFSHVMQNRLVIMNDDKQMSFKEIAKYVEETLIR